jgi:hypothetical protein
MAQLGFLGAGEFRGQFEVRRRDSSIFFTEWQPLAIICKTNGSMLTKPSRNNHRHDRSPNGYGAIPKMKDYDSQRLNAICPYYTMYPIEFPLRVLRHARQKQWVLDPFCGRGTTNLAARLLGLNTIGIDASPIATAIASAKLIQVSAEDVIQEAYRILMTTNHKVDVPTGDFWNYAFDRHTLVDICRLRTAVGIRPKTSEQTMLRAIILGVLHGPLTKGRPSYLSNQAPRTFAPKPTYAASFWKKHRLKPRAVNVLDLIRHRAEHCLHSQPGTVNGAICHGDAREKHTFSFRAKFSWVITSPPYYGMRTYISDQWLRNWFIGGPPHVPYGQPENELRHSSPECFSSELRKVWKNIEASCVRDARLVCRFGGINDRKADPLTLLKNSFEGTSWQLLTIRSAGTAHSGKRQASQFGMRGRSLPRREYDVYAALQA